MKLSKISIIHDPSRQKPVLFLHSVSKSYGSHKVLTDFSMDFSSGTFYCLMAPSGSGKTTLFRLLLGLEQADSGTICFHSPSDTAVLRISAVFQEDRLLENFTALENLRFAIGNTYSKETLTAYLLRLLPEDALKKPVREFSGGMKRRTAILRAILSPADIILMDEPFTGLDADTKQAAIDMIKECCAGKLLIAATHAAEDAALLNAAMIHL